MRVNEANIFLFIAAIIIGVLIAMNISLDGEQKYLDVVQYQEAYAERTQLQNEISDLEDEYHNINKKINKYKKSDKTQYEVMTEITEELNVNKMLLGQLPVEGDGVKITLNDDPALLAGAPYQWHMCIHDTDLAMVVNDLKSAGVEAIAVNGHRLSVSTSIFCSGATIDLDGVKIVAPFSIVAIGNKGLIETFIENQTNHIKALEARNCFVKVEPIYGEKLPAYTGKLKTQFLSEKIK